MEMKKAKSGRAEAKRQQRNYLLGVMEVKLAMFLVDAHCGQNGICWNG